AASLLHIAKHFPHSLDHFFGPGRPPDFERLVSGQKEPRRDPQGRQAFNMIVVQVRQEDLRYLAWIHPRLIEPLHHATTRIKKQLPAALLSSGGENPTRAGLIPGPPVPTRTTLICLSDD